MASKDLRINEEITAREVRLIDDAGEQSVISLSDALAKAQEASLDLVEVSPAAVPPVCRILNYGKYKFEQEKRAKLLRKNQTIVKVKEIRMQAKISTHDLEFKAKHVWEFLQEGNKVKVTIRFKGRELAHTELGKVILERMLAMITAITEQEKSVAFNLEQAPKMEGRNMNMLVAPKKE